MEANQLQPSLRHPSSPQDFFLHLLAMIALYISAVSFLTIVFQMINIVFFDMLEFGSLYSFYDKMRFSLASIIVVFPVYVGVMWYFIRAYRLHQEKRNIAIRRWLVTITLFVAALIIIGDTIALLRSLLSGETTLRFFLKVLAIFFVAGSIMTYYIWEGKIFKTRTDGV